MEDSDISISAVRQRSPVELNTAEPLAIDLDAAASATPTPAVVSAMIDALGDRYGNPSSAHWRGENARILLAVGRDRVAGLVSGGDSEGVVFTSGCTEANNLVLASYAASGSRIIVSAVEHPSVLNTARHLAAAGVDVQILSVDRRGCVDLDELRAAILASSGPVLVSIQAANSETGVRQDLKAIAELLEPLPAVFHADAAQAAGKVDLVLGRGRGPDLVTISGHKLNGPMGIGAVIPAEDFQAELTPLIHGGGQERGIRSGTQSLPSIAGFAAASEEWISQANIRRIHLASLRDELESELRRIDDVVINGSLANRAPHISSITFAGCDAMALVLHLDRRGVAVSQGSACSSRKPEASPTLVAMGLDEGHAFSTIRFSISVHNHMEEIVRTAELTREIVSELRAK
jgi:cysteine desulfurase